MNERLTARDCKGNAIQITTSSTGRPFHTDEIWENLAAYEDTGLSPEQVAKLAAAQREGRMVVLPCRIGDPIFGVWEDDTFCTEINNIKPPYVKETKFTLYWLDKVGKTVYLTREEAEAALKAQEGE